MQFYRIFSLVLISLLATGCASWHAIKESPVYYVAREKPRAVRVSLPESTFILSHLAVHGDTLVGVAIGDPQRQVVVSSREIRKLEIRFPRSSTGGKILVGTIGALAIIFAVVLIGESSREIY